MKIRRKATPHRFLTGCRIHGWRPQVSKDKLAESVRDAAHEAFHALTVGLEDWSDREEVHRRLMRTMAPSTLWLHEIEARVTERELCARFGLDTGRTLEEWIYHSAMEAIRTRVPHADPEKAVKLAQFPRARIVENVNRILRFERFPTDRLSWED